MKVTQVSRTYTLETIQAPQLWASTWQRLCTTQWTSTSTGWGPAMGRRYPQPKSLGLVPWFLRLFLWVRYNQPNPTVLVRIPFSYVP
jgi:hypothetical protein